jgi:hypothetical protein
MVKHGINLEQHIQLNHTAILSTTPRYMDRIIKEANEIKLHPNNIDMEDGLCLSNSLKPLFCSLKDCRKPPSHNRRSGFSVSLSAVGLLGGHGETSDFILSHGRANEN